MINKLNILVKNEWLWGYKINPVELTIRYGLSSAKDVMRCINIENKTLKQAFLDSADELREDIESSLVDDNDYFGYDNKEQLENRIEEETEFLRLLAKECN